MIISYLENFIIVNNLLHWQQNQSLTNVYTLDLSGKYFLSPNWIFISTNECCPKEINVYQSDVWFCLVPLGAIEYRFVCSKETLERKRKNVPWQLKIYIYVILSSSLRNRKWTAFDFFWLLLYNSWVWSKKKYFFERKMVVKNWHI